MFHHRNALLLLAGSYFLLPACPATAQVLAAGFQTAPYLQELVPILTDAFQLAQKPPFSQALTEELEEVTVTCLQGNA